MTVTFPALSASEAALLLPALEAINLSQLQDMAARGPVPSVIGAIQAGLIRYRRRDPQEEWVNYRELLARGVGDCEDLSAAVAAELVFRGVPAEAWPYQTSTPGLVHVIVRAEPWGFLDPSRSAGMGGGLV